VTGFYIGCIYVLLGLAVAGAIAWRSSKVPGARFTGGDTILAALVWPLVLYWYVRYGFLEQ
jgi:hypothetical protein